MHGNHQGLLKLKIAVSDAGTVVSISIEVDVEPLNEKFAVILP